VEDVYGIRPWQLAVPLEAIAQQPGVSKRNRAAG
jgi:hypothetical protein